MVSCIKQAHFIFKEFIWNKCVHLKVINRDFKLDISANVHFSIYYFIIIRFLL